MKRLHLLISGDHAAPPPPHLATLLARSWTHPGGAYWLRADPVHLSAGLHHVTVFDDRHFRLTEEATDALITTLNAHFAGEMEFLAPHPLR